MEPKRIRLSIELDRATKVLAPEASAQLRAAAPLHMIVLITIAFVVDMRQENHRPSDQLLQLMDHARLHLQHGIHTAQLCMSPIVLADLIKAPLTVEDRPVVHVEVVSAKAVVNTTRILAL